MPSYPTLRRVFWLSILAAFFLATTAMNAPEQAKKCEVSISLKDTTALPFTNTAITALIDNPVDTIVGFKIWVQLDRPTTIMKFRNDSAIKFDTSGTLLSGWEFLDARSIVGDGSDLQITGIANLIGGPFTHGIYPQTGGTFIKILAKVFDDTDPFSDRLVGAAINPYLVDKLEIVTQDLNWTIWEPQEIIDTVGLVCLQWDIDTTHNPPETLGCLQWQHTSAPPWDSFYVLVDTLLVLDTTKLCLDPGLVEILPPPTYLCGDANGDSAVGNILDLTFLVDHVFRGGPQSVPQQASDCNCDGAYGNILDLIMVVDLVFRSGPALCTGPNCN